MVRSIALRGFDQVLLPELQSAILHIVIVIFVIFEGGYFLLVCAANGRSSDRLHGGLWNQVCMEVCPKESGQTLLRSPAGDLD